jgi:hypothetical protein
MKHTLKLFPLLYCLLPLFLQSIKPVYDYSLYQ